MGEVIRLGPIPPQTEWKFTMDFFRDVKQQWSADITSFADEELEPADRLRQIADGLDAISFMTKQKAEGIMTSEQGSIVATINIYRSSRVEARINYKLIMTKEQEEWLRERIDDAKDLVEDLDKP